jgi:hypothetical protein
MTVVAWIYSPKGGPVLVLGEYNRPGGGEVGLLRYTDDAEVARRWARALRAGRLPPTAEEPAGPRRRLRA